MDFGYCFLYIHVHMHNVHAKMYFLCVGVEVGFLKSQVTITENNQQLLIKIYKIGVINFMVQVMISTVFNTTGIYTIILCILFIIHCGI